MASILHGSSGRRYLCDQVSLHAGQALLKMPQMPVWPCAGNRIQDMPDPCTRIAWYSLWVCRPPARNKSQDGGFLKRVRVRGEPPSAEKRKSTPLAAVFYSENGRKASGPAGLQMVVISRTEPFPARADWRREESRQYHAQCPPPAGCLQPDIKTAIQISLTPSNRPAVAESGRSRYTIGEVRSPHAGMCESAACCPPHVVR